MKIGQMASYLDQGLAEPVREQLAQLQAERAADVSRARGAGRRAKSSVVAPERVFASWDAMPFAAASIGQVHRATTHDGVAVAVKVQYPGVDEAIESDLANAGLLVQLIGMVFPGVEPEPIVDELRVRIREELDYVLRGRQPAAVRSLLRATIRSSTCPPWSSALSTGRVLTTELAEGARFDELLTWPQDERNLAAEAIYRFVFGSLYRLGAFNGDPHPGNYLFRAGRTGDVPRLRSREAVLGRRAATCWRACPRRSRSSVISPRSATSVAKPAS